ncbi:MAG: outer membrane lipoprotein-sorting protein [Vicinamibacterales bacterium]
MAFGVGMKRVVVVLAVVAGTLVLMVDRPAARQAAAETADWVARQIDARDTGHDSRLAMTMRLTDRQGRTRERALVITTLRADATRGDRVLVRFLGPADIKGTGFLMWEHADQDDERFLYLPALGRVRRIAGAEAQESFVGSDLSYEDIGGRKLSDYTYRMLDAAASWTDASGAAHPAWRLESTAKDASARYPVARTLVRKDAFVVVAADVLNRRGEIEKRYTVAKMERSSSIWTVMDATMSNDATHTRTTLVVTEARYNLGLKDDAFSRRALEQGAP